MQKDVNQTEIDEEVTKKKLDMELDRELEDTFPASDALKNHPHRHPDAFFKTELQDVKHSLMRSLSRADHCLHK